MQGVLISPAGTCESVECAASATGVVTLRGQEVRGFTQPHSSVTVYELGEWSAAVTASSLLSLPPSLCAKLLVPPVLVLRAPVAPLTVAAYMELVQASQAEMGVVAKRQQYRAQLRAAQGTVLEEVARRTKRGGVKAARQPRGKSKCKEASEESEQNDVCDLEDEEEEEGEDVLDGDEGEGDEDDDQDDGDEGDEAGEEDEVAEDDSEVEEDEEVCDESGAEEEQVMEAKKARRKS